MPAPRLLIPDNTPLSLLALLGEEGLDMLFAPGLEVWITDMVMQEAVRAPGDGNDQRTEIRATLRGWLARNAGRIHIQETPEGRLYKSLMDSWEALGRPPAARPAWTGRGETSIRDALQLVVSGALAPGESVLLLVDDRAARRLLAQTLEEEGLEGDVVATETFLAWVERRFGVEAAATAWTTIALASGARQPDAPEDDPISVRII